MPLPQTSKQKSARVDWGYVRRREPQARTRRRLWVLAAGLVAVPLGGLTVAAALSGEPARSFAAAASRGPVASVHAAWDNNCEACHEPFRPIGADDWIPRFADRTLGTALAAGHGASNARCEACHAGPPHHPNQRPETVAGCADCHRDHRGRDASLVRLADATCTGCHANLADHRVAAAVPAVAPRVGSFAADHPQFRHADPAGAAPRRGLKFSHAAHMLPGMGVKFRPADIRDAADRGRYLALLGSPDPAAPAQLACVSCHQLDAARPDGAGSRLTPAERFTQLTAADLGGVPREPVLPPRAAGAYFLPVVFENHCRACHPLTFDEAPDLAARQVPHRVSPADLGRFLTEVYTTRYVADKLRAAAAPDRGPGRLDPPLRDLDPDAKADALRAGAAAAGAAGAGLLAPVRDAVAGATRGLLSGRHTCLECHYAEPSDGSGPPARIVPAPIPTVWQDRARFHHSSHRAMTCAECHPGSYRTKESELAAAAEPYQHRPDLPGIDTCRQCHAPAAVVNDRPVGGVRHGCTDCHSYHHADRGLQGLGSAHRDPAGPGATAAELLGGRPRAGR